MIDDRKLNRKYKEIQKQNTPDLWNRIESGLQPIDRSEDLSPKLSADQIRAVKKAGSVHRRYGWAAAAAIFGIVLIGSRLGIPRQNMSEMSTAAMAEAEDSAAGEILMAEVTTVAFEAEPAVSQENTAQQPTETTYVTLRHVSSLQVPDNAWTVPYNAGYFSEDILKETNLLCGAVITDVSFAYDDSGYAIYVIYDMTVSDVFYAQDYVAGMDEISVTSPIIETDGDEAYLLYQMQVGGHYLLPLKEQENGWELLYPFAPQIQVLDEQSFVFHSGYKSLITGQAKAVAGVQEGENDFYYDRMVMREDSAFLSDLVSLVK